MAVTTPLAPHISEQLMCESLWLAYIDWKQLKTKGGEKWQHQESTRRSLSSPSSKQL